MGWKSTMHVSRTDAVNFVFSRLRDFNDTQVNEYLQRIVAARCSNKVLEDVMEDMVDEFHELGLDTESYYGHNFIVEGK